MRITFKPAHSTTLPFVALLLVATNAADYCNWNGCNGEAQGGDWCNESKENCEVGCGNGGLWCSGGGSGPPPTTSPDPQGYCNWSGCNGDVQGGDWCNESKENCEVGCGNGGVWCSQGGTNPDPSPPSSPSPSPSPSPSAPQEGTLRATHFWDCSGGACDAKTLQPWDASKYRYSAFYAPLDPTSFPGGPWYGEKMWMTGAASDVLSAMMGSDDGCCGEDSEGIGGCGKCLLVSNPSAVNSDWKAVVMKKNRCPPYSAGCDKAHLDIAVPGYDNLQYSLANICGSSDTMISKDASSTCGDWYNRGSNTIQGCDCSALPGDTETQRMLKTGCELFTAWGWDSGNPILNYEVVECPSEFKAIISQAFGAAGPQY